MQHDSDVRRVKALQSLESSCIFLPFLFSFQTTFESRQFITLSPSLSLSLSLWKHSFHPDLEKWLIPEFFEEESESQEVYPSLRLDWIR